MLFVLWVHILGPQKDSKISLKL
ncbi:hypothetical protein OYC64_018766 [Pagothenia borchgrevinki]|uniref:Uncharacterized protein n=1 Tax=Pagothenia borchgrevinki TaxID=8213 RepID=A0ABD2GQ04_PAGBO